MLWYIIIIFISLILTLLAEPNHSKGDYYYEVEDVYCIKVLKVGTILYEITKTSSSNSINVYTYSTDAVKSSTSGDIPLSSNAQLRVSGSSVYISDNKIVIDNSNILNRVEQVILYKVSSSSATTVAWTITESLNHHSLDDMCIFQLQNGNFVLSILDTTTIHFFHQGGTSKDFSVDSPIFIQCASFSSGISVCMYSRNPDIWFFSMDESDLSKKANTTLYDSSMLGNEFFYSNLKIIPLSSTNFIYCFTHLQLIFYCGLGAVGTSSISSLLTPQIIFDRIDKAHPSRVVVKCDSEELCYALTVNKDSKSKIQIAELFIKDNTFVQYTANHAAGGTIYSLDFIIDSDCTLNVYYLYGTNRKRKNQLLDYCTSCNDKTIELAMDNTKEISFDALMENTFLTDENMFIVISSKPSNEFLLSNGTSVTSNVFYNFDTKFRYTAGSTAITDTIKFYFTHYGQTTKTTCTYSIDVFLCYSTCASCTLRGTATINNCVTCKANHYMIEDDTKGTCIDTLDGYYLSTADTPPIFKKCDEGCLLCTDSGSNCQQCDNDNGYYLKNENSCVKNCGPDQFLYNNLCRLNCSDELVGYGENNDTYLCEYCKDKGKYLYLKKCISPKPENYYFSDPINYVIEPCYSKCAQCEGEGSDTFHNCTKCISGTFLHEKNCLNSCPECLYEDRTQNECVNCKARNQFSFYEGQCVSVPPSNSYLYQNETNCYKPCYYSCATCYGEGTVLNHNCSSCPSSYSKQEDKNCYVDCGEIQHLDRDTNQCVNCASFIPPLFFYPEIDECIDEIPSHFYLWNTSYNVIKECYRICKTCSTGGDATNNNCDSCYGGSFLLAKNCESTCPKCLYKDRENNKCVNCREEQKFYFNTECVDSPPSNGFLINSTTNCYDSCYYTCASCNVKGNNNEHFCESCSDSFPIEENKNCYKNCYDLMYLDKDNNICINCKTNKQFYYPPTKSCVDAIPEGYFVSDEYYNRVDMCHYKCKNCEKLGSDDNTTCTECKENLFFYLSHCYEECPYYLVVDDIAMNCVNCKARNQFLFFEGENKKCIDEVPKGYFVYEEDPYGIIKKCIFNCENDEIQNEKFVNFCSDEIVRKTCIIPIYIDEYLSVQSYPLDDTMEEILKFILLSDEERIEKINEMIINMEDSDIMTAVNSLALISEMIKLSKNEYTKEYLQKLYKDLIKKISKILNCLQLRELFAKESSQDILSTASALYNTISNQEFIEEEELIALAIIEKCIVEFGREAFNKNDFESEINQDDFTNIHGNSVSKMIALIASYPNNESDNEKYKDLRYLYNETLIFSNSRMRVMETIEYISLMVTQYKNSDEYNYPNIKFISFMWNELPDNNYNQSGIFLTAKKCDDIEKIKEQIELLNYKAKICFPYEEINKKYPNISTVNAISYEYYPLFNNQSKEHFKEDFVSVVLRYDNLTKVNISGLNETIKIILAKKENKFNECLYYDGTEDRLNNTNCSSFPIDNDYLLCECNHLTVFTISDLNPKKLFSDIIRLLKQARLITSFKPFKFLNWKNATVLYTIGGILLIYSIVLIFTIKSDLHSKEDCFVTVIQKEPNTNKREDALEELEELDEKMNNYFHKKAKPPPNQKKIDSSSVIDEKDSTRREINTSEVKTLTANNNQKKEERTFWLSIKEYFFLFKEFFNQEYWFCCLFLTTEGEMTKTNFLSLFAIKFVASLTLSSIFTECSEKEQSANEALFNNRDLAVALITIAISEIPFTILEIMISKTKISYRFIPSKKKYRLNTLYRYIFVYFVFFCILVFGTINTTWISLDSEYNNFDCHFLSDFFLSVVIDCFIYQILVLFIKALLYILILRWCKGSYFREILLFVVSSLPWLFALYG